MARTRGAKLDPEYLEILKFMLKKFKKSRFYLSGDIRGKINLRFYVERLAFPYVPDWLMHRLVNDRILIKAKYSRPPWKTWYLISHKAIKKAIVRLTAGGCA